MESILLRGGLILPMNEPTPSLREGFVGVVNNRIEVVGYDDATQAEFLERYPASRIVECDGGVVMPGLVNTHCHVSMTLLRNYADDMELMEWLTKYVWPFEALLSEEDIASGARLGIAEMLLGGCTTFIDMYWSEWAIAEVVRDMGCRAMLAETVLDGVDDLFNERMDKLRERAEGVSRVECCVAPHAPYTCSEATLKRAVDYAKRYDLPITIHLNETEAERDDIEKRYGCTPLEYIERAGVVGERTILAHCVWLNEDEIRRVAAAGASVAHNAQSNLKLASGIAPVAKMLQEGVNCTIATDGVASNNDLDMWEEMRTATLLQRVKEMDATALPAYKALQMATVGGARALGHNDLGVIEQGALADIIVVDLSKPHLRPRSNVVSSLIYSAKSSDVRHVLVDGALLVSDGELVGVDVEQLCQDVEQRKESILQRL